MGRRGNVVLPKHRLVICLFVVERVEVVVWGICVSMVVRQSGVGDVVVLGLEFRLLLGRKK